MSESEPQRSGMYKSEWRAWRVLFEGFLAIIFMGIGSGLWKPTPELKWRGILAAGFMSLGGALFVIHGIHCIRWRQTVAEFWASMPGGNWFVSDPDPVRHHRGKAVIAGLVSILMGCGIGLCVIGLLIKLIDA